MSSARVSIQARGNGFAPLATLYQCRAALAQGAERSLPEPEAALLIGIVLGLKTPALRARLPLFVATGTIHLVVPAGLKVALLADMASRAARRLGPWPQTSAALVAVGAYAALGGGGPAATRAAIMGALLALAPALGRTYNVYTALALAVLIMTGIEPALINDAGFQLTALAPFGLPLPTPGLQAALLRLAGPRRDWRATLFITETLAVTMAAQIATLPVLALTFHTVSLVAPLANLLTVPLLAPLFVLGAALATCAALGLGPVAMALAWITWPALAWVDGAISWTAGLPLAALQLSQAPLALAPLYYVVAVGAISALRPWLRAARDALEHAASGASASRGQRMLGRRALVAAVVLAVVASVGASIPALASGGKAHIDFLDVGPGGSAILLREPGGFTALIDGGPSGPALETALAGRIPFWQRNIDLAALTDVRAGDARGLEDAAAHYHIGLTLDAGMVHPGVEYLAYLDAMRRSSASRRQARADNVVLLPGGASLAALAPPQTLYPPNEGDSQASDDLILRLETPGLSVLLLGAAEAYALDALAGSGEPQRADVVELALPRGATLDLAGPLGVVLRAAHPRLIVICDSPEPAPKGFAAIIADMGPSDAQAGDALNTQLYRVSAGGAISLSGGPHGWAMG
ncbi:MAG TPA: ComEC/Rec2 family competence protein [Ktedonobacterales bacterium]